MPYGYGDLSYIMEYYGYTTAWRMIYTDADDYQNGDVAQVVSWSSAGGSASNVVQSLELNGIDKSASVSGLIVSGAACLLGAAALL